MENDNPQGSVRYEVRLAELLAQSDSGRFSGCDIRPRHDGSTAVTTPPMDQSALHRFLRTLRDTGMTLVSIRPSIMESEMKNPWLKARVLGFAFLFQAVSSLASGIFFAPSMKAGTDGIGFLAQLASHPLFARIGILCDMGTALGVIFLGAALCAALRKHGEVLAFTGFGLYILEGALIAAGRIEAFSLLLTGQGYAAAGSPPVFSALAAIGSEAAAFGSMTLSMAAFSVGAIPLYFLLLKSRIVPRPIGIWGLLSVLFCLVGTVLSILGFKPPLVFYLPYIPFEFFIALWILIRGVRTGGEE
jgi:hypothetical protein